MRYFEVRDCWLPDPVVNIDIGQSVSNKIVEEGKIEKSSFLPIFLGVAEHIMQGRHEEDVGRDEDEKRNWGNISAGCWLLCSAQSEGVILTIFTGAEGVSKQYQNKQSSDYLEKNWEEEDAPEIGQNIVRIS